MSASSTGNSTSTTTILSTDTTIRRPLSVDQLTDVRDTLKGPPLTNRSVLIPFGRKAFLPGRLAPILLQKTDQDEPCVRSNSAVSDGTAVPVVAKTSRRDGYAKEHETVLVHHVHDGCDKVSTDTTKNGVNNGVQMTRQEALNYLQIEMDNLKKKPLKQQTQTSSKKIHSSTTGSNRSTPTAASTATATTTIVGSDLPFIEIREELDDTGNVITGKAINVTKHLNYLSQHQQQDEEDEATAKNLQNEPLSMNDTNKEEMKTAQTHPLNENTMSATSEDTHSTTVPPPQPDQTKITEEQYNAISRRLDELMLLEEQQEQKHNRIPTMTTTSIKTTKTSKSSKNKGWAKGFLNSPKESNTIPATTTTTSSKPKIISHQYPTTTTTNALSSLSNNKKVSFTDQDDIQEIPRIGQRSITSLQQQQQPHQSSSSSSSLGLPTNHMMAPVPSSDTPNRVIASQVIEKKQSHRRRSTNVSRIETNVQSSSSSSSMGDDHSNNSASSHSEPTKKLSRFAQERQQMLK